MPFGEPVWLGWMMIAALLYSGIPIIVLGRLKRKKLALKEEMARIEYFLNPDIIA